MVISTTENWLNVIFFKFSFVLSTLNRRIGKINSRSLTSTSRRRKMSLSIRRSFSFLSSLTFSLVYSYPFSEDTSKSDVYMETRCPSWCDRVLLSNSSWDWLQSEVSCHPLFNFNSFIYSFKSWRNSPRPPWPRVNYFLRRFILKMIINFVIIAIILWKWSLELK